MNKNTINIIKLVIDIKKINNEISVRQGIKDSTLNYLVMNNETLDQLRIWTKDPICGSNITYNYGYETYRGIPIAICEKLKLGEVEFV